MHFAFFDEGPHLVVHIGTSQTAASFYGRVLGAVHAAPGREGSVEMSMLTVEKRDGLPARKFAEPDKRAYPNSDKTHAQNAKGRASQAADTGPMAQESRAHRAANKLAS